MVKFAVVGRPTKLKGVDSAVKGYFTVNGVVTGSSPVPPVHGGLAQLVEHLFQEQRATGSIPVECRKAFNPTPRFFSVLSPLEIF